MNILRKYLLRRDFFKAVNRRRRTITRRLTRDVYGDQRTLFDQLGKEPKVIVDIGAFRGEITARYLKLFPQATLYAVEPFPESFNTLKERFQGNSQVNAYCVAMADQIGETEFFTGQLPNTNSLLQQSHVSKESTIVSTLTLDELTRKTSIDHIHILKIDTEGAELKVLKGAIDLLSAGRIDIISTEYRLEEVYIGESLLPELIVFLNRYNYNLHNIYVNRENRFRQADYGDAVFVSHGVSELITTQKKASK